MPQITLQYTDKIKLLPDFNFLFSEVHQMINSIAGIKIENCKSRAIKLDNYLVGDGINDQGFIHMEIKILEGRTNDIKSEIGKRIIKILEKQFKESIELLNLQITIEIIDIQKNCYYKYPKGTLNH